MAEICLRILNSFEDIWLIYRNVKKKKKNPLIKLEKNKEIKMLEFPARIYAVFSFTCLKL
jgi:hypothetical protein